MQPSQTQHADSGDYTWPGPSPTKNGLFRPTQIFDTRTIGDRLLAIERRLADIENRQICLRLDLLSARVDTLQKHLAGIFADD